MIHIQDKVYYDKVLAYAESIGKKEDLDELLARVANFGENVYLYKDFAPYSFTFVVRNSFAGGIIYHGFDGGSGGAPSFAVSVSDTDGWSIHT